MTAGLDCLDGLELLADYLEDALPLARRQSVDAHLAVCPRCVAFVASYRETSRIFRVATAATLSEELRASLWRFLRGHGVAQ